METHVPSARATPSRRGRPAWVRLGSWLGWPAGLVIGNIGAAGVVPTPLFAVLAAAYVATMLVLLRRLDAGRDRAAAALALSGVGVFALAGLTGVPTARLPGAMIANAAVLLAAAVTLLVAAVVLALRAGLAGRVPAALGLVALVVGSSGYLLNLLARGAVVASGAAGQQVAVEESAWVASAYLTGLPPEPTYLAYLLVWLDLVQLAYIALTYLAFAALATALGRAGAVSGRVSRAVARTGASLAALVLVAAAAAGAVPGVGGTIGAWTAFVLTIPFMSTLLPYVLGIGLLRHR